MTPRSRDRNLGRLRGLTGAIAGVSLAACGLFAGLAASATKHVFSASATPAGTTTTTTASGTTATSPSSLSAPQSTPVQTSQTPVASSGGS